MTRTRSHRLRRLCGRVSTMATVSPGFASFFSSCTMNFDVSRVVLPYSPSRTCRSTATTMLFCILLLTTTPTFSAFCDITRPSSAGSRSSRARGRAARGAACRGSRAAPSTSGCACGRADRSASARAPRVRPSRADAVLQPSLHLLLREPRRELGEDRDLRGGELHRLARFLLAHPFHLEQDLAGPDDGDPLLRRALALAHARFLRLLRDRLVREDAHPHLAAAGDEARHRDARRLDLAVGEP